MRSGEGVSDRAVLADRPAANATGVVDDVFGLASGLASEDGQAHEMIAAAFLHGEIDGAAIGRPLRRALAVVNNIADFAAIAAVVVHQPDVCVFLGGFAVGETAASTEIEDGLSIRRPQRIIFAILGSG